MFNAMPVIIKIPVAHVRHAVMDISVQAIIIKHLVVQHLAQPILVLMATEPVKPIVINNATQTATNLPTVVLPTQHAHTAPKTNLVESILTAPVQQLRRPAQ